MLTLPVLLVSMDMSVLHLALPAITADLGPSSTQLLWVIDVYAFCGRQAADHHGCRG